jgi:hypothetical protein
LNAIPLVLTFEVIPFALWRATKNLEIRIFNQPIDWPTGNIEFGLESAFFFFEKDAEAPHTFGLSKL